MSVSVFITGLLAVIIFGASPVAAKVALQNISAMDVAVLRTVIGGAIALPLIFLFRLRWPQTNNQRYLLIVSGFCGFVGFPVFFTMGVEMTSAKHGAMILAMLPVFTGAIAKVWDRTWPRRLWWIGCAIAVVGEFILISGNANANGGQGVYGDLLVLLSNVFASIGYVAGGRLQRSGYSSKATAFWGVTLFAIVLLAYIPYAMDISSVVNAGALSLSGLLFLAVGVTIIGYIMWYWALGTGGIARVGLLQFLQPISGIILAWWLLAEPLTAGFLVATAIIMSGVIIAFKAGQ